MPDGRIEIHENLLRNPVRLSISARALPLASNGLSAGLADDTTINSPFRGRAGVHVRTDDSYCHSRSFLEERAVSRE